MNMREIITASLKLALSEERPENIALNNARTLLLKAKPNRKELFSLHNHPNPKIRALLSMLPSLPPKIISRFLFDGDLLVLAYLAYYQPLNSVQIKKLLENEDPNISYALAKSDKVLSQENQRTILSRLSPKQQIEYLLKINQLPTPPLLETTSNTIIFSPTISSSSNLPFFLPYSNKSVPYSLGENLALKKEVNFWPRIGQNLLKHPKSTLLLALEEPLQVQFLWHPKDSELTFFFAFTKDYPNKSVIGHCYMPDAPGAPVSLYCSKRDSKNSPIGTVALLGELTQKGKTFEWLSSGSIDRTCLSVILETLPLKQSLDTNNPLSSNNPFYLVGTLCVFQSFYIALYQDEDKLSSLWAPFSISPLDCPKKITALPKSLSTGISLGRLEQLLRKEVKESLFL